MISTTFGKGRSGGSILASYTIALSICIIFISPPMIIHQNNESTLFSCFSAYILKVNEDKQAVLQSAIMLGHNYVHTFLRSFLQLLSRLQGIIFSELLEKNITELSIIILTDQPTKRPAMFPVLLICSRSDYSISRCK